jgi:predicted porin
MFRKTQIACMAATAWACTGAHAQSSVTLYGVADTTVEWVRTTGANKPGGNVPPIVRQDSNSSLWGMKGREDLGGGLAAIFQIEYGYNVNSGSGPSARDQYVGLTSNRYGTLQFGYLTSPMRALGGKLNFIPGSTSIANNIGIMTTLNGTQTNLNARLANSILYTTPTFKGLNGQVVYSPGGGNVSPTNSSVSGTAGSPNTGMYAWGGGAQYASGPLYIAYAYESRRDQALLGAGSGLSGAASAGMGVAAAGYSNDYEHRVAIRYEANFFAFGSTSFATGWDRLGSKGTFGSGKAAGDGQTYRDAFTLSIMQKVGPQDFILNYAFDRPLSCSGAATNGQCSAAERPHTGAQQWVFAYHYWLSKRTMLEAYVSRIHNSSFGTYDYDTNPVVTSVAARAPGGSPLGAGVGIRHTF